MADIDVRRVHGLGMAAARMAAERMAEDLGRKFDLRGEWEGDVLRFQRPGVTGSLAITARELHLSVSLGFLLRAMKGSIERAVLEELDTLFASPAPKSPAPSKSSAGRGAPRAKKAPRPPKRAG
jgi:putative polyhydroxyalkanoate system protein